MHYVSHLSKDRKLKKIVEKQKPHNLVKRKNICTWLCASIMSQQLSTKVADIIHKRYLGLYDGNEPSPQQILETPFEKLRGIGMSNAKANYVQNVARFQLESGLEPRKLHKMTDDEVVEYLTQIKGVGRWTTEMLLMFALGREDVFAVDDLGIQNAMIRLYKLDNKNKKQFRQEMIAISQRWSPYRTYACIHLWRWKDNEPVVKKKKKTK